ncbi:MAG: hypothetical protein IPJ85_00375 [Flavobacteriales bacterium]|nr:hypothetical protein [Flavobacteriales bacterium]
MNRRLLILLIVLLSLGALAWWLQRRSTGTTLNAPLIDFAVKDTSRVTRLFIADQRGNTSDLRRDGDRWILNGRFEARQPEVNAALKTLLRVEVRSPVPKSQEPMVLRTMGSASLKVEIYEGGNKPSKTWILGHATKDHYGTYAVLEKPDQGRSAEPFILGMSGFTGVLTPRFPPREDNWRSPSVFHYNDLRDLAEVEVMHTARPSESFRILHPEAGLPSLQSSDGRTLPMDTVLVQGALLPFKEFNYDYIERERKPVARDSLLAVKPNYIVRAKGRNGRAQEVKLWYKPYTGEAGGFDKPRPLHDPLHMFAFVEDSMVVSVQRAYADRFTVPLSSLLY